MPLNEHPTSKPRHGVVIHEFGGWAGHLADLEGARDILGEVTVPQINVCTESVAEANPSDIEVGVVETPAWAHYVLPFGGCHSPRLLLLGPQHAPLRQCAAMPPER